MEMPFLKSIVYTCTLQCNFDCKHCGEQKHRQSVPELNCGYVLERIKQAKMVERGCYISITGGEPFLKENLADFILGLTNDPGMDVRVDVTTTGYFSGRIEEVASKIKEPSKILFSVSVDGLETAHNAIRRRDSYKRAVETVQLLSSYGIPVEVNMVMQKENMGDIPYLGILARNLGDNIAFSPVPYTTSAGFDKKFPYCDEDIPVIFPYLRTKSDMKYVLSNGRFHIEDCQAGSDNIVIDPQGKVYTCNYGCSYIDPQRKNDYCIGDLTRQGLDEVLRGERREQVLRNTVKNCAGCNANGDMYREENRGNFHGILTKKEAQKLFDYLEPPPPALYDFGWDNLVTDGSLRYRWMTQKKAKVFLAVDDPDGKEIQVEYRNIYPTDGGDPLSLTLSTRSRSVNQLCPGGVTSVAIPVSSVDIDNGLVELSFEVNHTWSPAELWGSNDRRTLGIAVLSAEVVSFTELLLSEESSRS